MGQEHICEETTSVFKKYHQDFLLQPHLCPAQLSYCRKPSLIVYVSSNQFPSNLNKFPSTPCLNSFFNPSSSQKVSFTSFSPQTKKNYRAESKMFTGPCLIWG